jgi:hypothetical protein
MNARSQTFPRPLGVLLAAIVLGGCGGGEGTTATEDATTRVPDLACPHGAAAVRTDPGGDVVVVSLRGPERPTRSPSADLVSAAVRRGPDGVLCGAFRTAGPIRRGSTFAITTRQAIGAAGAFDEQRYEVQLTPDGEVDVSRPHGEPRYPVRASVERRGDVLRVAMETLLRDDHGFDWRAESSYLPDFPLGDMYDDAIPDDRRWFGFPLSPSGTR